MADIKKIEIDGTSYDIVSKGMPIGGTAGQVLKKATGSDYATEWADETLDENPLPAGGNQGQVLAKNSNSDYDVYWKDNNAMPMYGPKGWALVKKSLTSFDATWARTSLLIHATDGEGTQPQPGQSGWDDMAFNHYVSTTDSSQTYMVAAGAFSSAISSAVGLEYTPKTASDYNSVIDSVFGVNLNPIFAYDLRFRDANRDTFSVNESVYYYIQHASLVNITTPCVICIADDGSKHVARAYYLDESELAFACDRNGIFVVTDISSLNLPGIIVDQNAVSLATVNDAGYPVCVEYNGVKYYAETIDGAYGLYRSGVDLLHLILPPSGTAGYGYLETNTINVHSIPSGGTSGQVLKKTNNNDYVVEWAEDNNYMPMGGSAGQVLKKRSSSNYDVYWGEESGGGSGNGNLPGGGTAGQFLIKTSDNDYDAGWITQPNVYDAYAVKTATGAVASFDDGAENIPVKDLTIDIDPVQNLNGYDNPWPGGGGKNLLKYPYANASGTYVGVPVTVNSDGTLTYNGTANATSWYTFFGTNTTTVSQLVPLSQLGLNAGDQITISTDAVGGRFSVQFNKADGTLTSPGSIYKDGAGSTTSTIPSDAVYAYIGFRFTNGTAYSGTNVKFQIEKGSSATTWTPYSNICPITGWTGANVYRTGTNLLDASTITDGYALNTANGGTYSNANWQAEEGYIPVTGEKITLSWESASGNYYQANVCFYNGAKTFISNSGTSWSGYAYSHTFDIPSGAAFARFSWAAVVSSNPYPRTNVRVNLGTSDLGYEPYSGTTYPISFSSAGTVYGGTLDVTTGLLTVDKASVDMGDLSYTRFIGAGYERYIFYSDIAGAKSDTPLQSSMYHYGTSSTSGSTIANQGDGYIGRQNVTGGIRTIITNDAYTDAESFETAMDGQIIVYDLATPITYQLTPTEVKTLLEDNNIWADTGDSTVKYRVDPSSAGGGSSISPYTSNPAALGTASPGSSANYARGDHVHAKPTAADIGAAPKVTEVTISTAGAVSQALDAGKIYHFTGALTSLTITLNAAGSGIIPQYHFDFDCGSTAPTVTIPNTVTMPDSNTFAASKHYEVDILGSYGVVSEWSAS